MRLLKRALVAGLVVLVGMAMLPLTAEAGWNRSFSSLEIYGDDLAVCADEMTFETLYRSNPQVLPPDFDYVLGAPYPYNGGNDSLKLFATANEAETDTSPLLTILVPLTLTVVDPGDVWHEFEGQATAATPAGYGDGDQLYVQTLGTGSTAFDSLALTIGDAQYDCTPPAPVLDAEFLIGGPAVQVRSGLPGILYFDATNINVRSFKIMADNGKIAPVRHLVTVNDTAFVFFKPRRAGVKCSSDSFILTGMTSDGHPVSDVLPIVPFPCPFPG